MKIKSENSTQGFYLTSLTESSKPPINLNEKISSFLSKNQNKFKETEQNVLDYMVHEETNYTDFNKISDYLENKIKEEQKIYNKNLNDIIIKKKYLEDLELQISEVNFITF